MVPDVAIVTFFVCIALYEKINASMNVFMPGSFLKIPITNPSFGIGEIFGKNDTGPELFY